ncbi:MAG: hypothetical protein FIA99_03555 [Ruminiclostridium sp.]|nr:hypothetical protein [Ruminiclostridium sp.]
MEWARAKNIIIILFIVLNVFLLSRIILEYGNQGISKEAVMNMGKILDSRGVVVECEIPRYDRDTPRLRFENWSLETAGLVEKLLGIKTDTGGETGGEEKTFENGMKKLVFTGPNTFTYLNGMPDDTVNISDLSETEKYLKKFLKDRKLDNPSYVRDGLPEREGSSVAFTYLEKYKGYLVFDNYLKAVVTDKGVTRLEAGQRKINGFSSEEISDISTAYQILLENFAGSDKAVITAIDLGYKEAGRDENGLQSSEQLPVWRIKVKGSIKPRWFGASDGKEIEPSE